MKKLIFLPKTFQVSQICPKKLSKPFTSTIGTHITTVTSIIAINGLILVTICRVSWISHFLTLNTSGYANATLTAHSLPSVHRLIFEIWLQCRLHFRNFSGRLWARFVHPKVVIMATGECIPVFRSQRPRSKIFLLKNIMASETSIHIYMPRHFFNFEKFWKLDGFFFSKRCFT